MSPSNDPPRHPVWDTFDYLLANQIRQACSLSKPKIYIDDDDFADILHQLIFDLAQGGSQKEIYGTLSPYLASPQQHTVFSELCSWIFSTEGVLSSLYQPVLSQDNVVKIEMSANERKYCARIWGIGLD